MVLAAAVSRGQSPAAQPAFATATVKRHPANNGPPSISPYGTGHFTATNAPLEFLMELAFAVDQNQIFGAPDWIYSERYDIDAKAEPGVSLTYEQVKPRLERLLRQRLKLASHREQKQLDGYELAIAPGGPKLRRSIGAAGTGSVSPGGMRFPTISMSVFAPILATPVGKPVVDKTGLKGNYDIDLKYSPTGNANANAPSIFAALQDQLGLLLQPRKVAVDTLVIDHVERQPAQN